MDNDYIERLESAFIDLVANLSLEDLKAIAHSSRMCMSDERCKEIQDLFPEVEGNYVKRHNIEK